MSDSVRREVTVIADKIQEDNRSVLFMAGRTMIEMPRDEYDELGCPAEIQVTLKRTPPNVSINITAQFPGL